MNKAAQRRDVICLQPHSLLGKESGQSLDHSQYCFHRTTEGTPEEAGAQNPLITRDTSLPKKEVFWTELALALPGCKIKVLPHCTSQLSQGLSAEPGRYATGPSATTSRDCPRLPRATQTVHPRRPGPAAQPVSCFPSGCLLPRLLVCIILCLCPHPLAESEMCTQKLVEALLFLHYLSQWWAEVVPDKM